jgi:hypothetical protein
VSNFASRFLYIFELNDPHPKLNSFDLHSKISQFFTSPAPSMAVSDLAAKIYYLVLFFLILFSLF